MGAISSCMAIRMPRSDRSALRELLEVEDGVLREVDERFTECEEV